MALFLKSTPKDRRSKKYKRSYTCSFVSKISRSGRFLASSCSSVSSVNLRLFRVRVCGDVVDLYFFLFLSVWFVLGEVGFAFRVEEKAVS